jgi:hypothetical protein
MNYLTKARISAMLPVYLIGSIKNFAKRENTTQSSIIERALKEQFEKKIAQDAKDLSKMKFDDLPSENEWLQIQAKKE